MVGALIEGSFYLPNPKGKDWKFCRNRVGGPILDLLGVSLGGQNTKSPTIIGKR